MKSLVLTSLFLAFAQVAVAEDVLVFSPKSLSCSASDQGGSVDAMCGADHPIRCHADIEFSDGSSGTIYGKECWHDLTDCFSTGPGAVNPCH